MEIKLCGVGGQGLGLAGRLLGEAAILAGLHVVESTAYGVESRGGQSTADIIISRDPILFPEVRSPDAILLLAEKGLDSNLRGTHSGTYILYDQGTVTRQFDVPGQKLPFPFLELALKRFDSREAATIIALGSLIQLTGVVPPALMEGAVKNRLPLKVHQQNIKALRLGRSLIKA